MLALHGVLHPPVNVAEMLDGLGVTISSKPLREYSGILTFDSAGGTVILNSQESAGRQRFTLACLLAHYIAEPPGTYFRMQGGKGGYEVDFAAELLMPKSLIENVLVSDPELATTELAQRFGVSVGAMEVALARLQERESPLERLGIATDASPEEAVQSAQAQLDAYAPARFVGLPADVVEHAALRRAQVRSLWNEARLLSALPFSLWVDERIPGPIASPERITAVLEEALALVERGWCQGAYARDSHAKRIVKVSGPDAGTFSLPGAISRAAQTASEIDIAFQVLAAHVEPPITASAPELQAWNNAAGRRKAEVLHLLREARASIRPPPVSLPPLRDEAD